MPDRPNILLFFVDQQRFDTIGCNGHPTCKTPALDRMASEGVRFTRAYSCCGLCSPARSSVMTGVYPHNHGQLTNTHDWHPAASGTQNDKLGNLVGNAVEDYLPVNDGVVELPWARDILRDVILGGGQNLLRPEKRLDAFLKAERDQVWG